MKKGKIPSFSTEPVDEGTMRRLEHLVSAHVDSFNYFLRTGLQSSVADISPMDITLESNGRANGLKETIGFAPQVRLFFSEINIAAPSRRDGVTDSKLTPREARERQITYNGAISGVMHAVVEIDESTSREFEFNVKFGAMPLMVMSEKCHLRGSNSKQLVSMGEEATEVGGYFILNGIERVIRLLQVPRRNHAMAIERSSYKNRGNLYSDKGVAMRCVREDQSGVTMTLHYLNNGGASVKFVLRKQEFLIPLIIVARALSNISDKEFFNRVLQGDVDNTFVSTRLELLLRDAKKHSLPYQSQCLAYLGSHFRSFLPVSSRTSDEEAGKLLIRKYFFVHVTAFEAKFECLLHMIRKLFCFAEGKCAADNADVLMNHELLLPGHLLTMIVKEKLEDILITMKTMLIKDYVVNRAKCLAELETATYFQKLADKCSTGIGRKIETFLSTGNLITSTGLDLQQVSGFTIVAERLNILRYLSHFQSVHRGQFFTTMKTTTVRKLFPESWGFLCPVHTPDGSPCGLLNHLAKEAVIMSFSANERLPTTPLGALTPPSSPAGNCEWATGKALVNLLVSMGLVPGGKGGADGEQILCPTAKGVNIIPVLIDGAVVGGLPSNIAADVVRQLRHLKVMGGGSAETCLDPTMELAYLPPVQGQDSGGVYPGLYIFTQPGRLIRPVVHLDSRRVEWVGPMEQVFMEIACLNDDVMQGVTSHVEISPDVVLSQVASLTPYSDYNQSPRNMYQCQMGKQTMGTPAHALIHRSDNKLYRIQTPQAPVVQTHGQWDYMMDEYPQGANAVVAVISYTGFDMDDAMIINKSAYERGFGHGTVYKTKVFDLDEEEKHVDKNGVKPILHFLNSKKHAASWSSKKNKIKAGSAPGGDDADDKFVPSLDVDGLPLEGEIVEPGEPLCCLVDEVSGQHRVIKNKEIERAYIDTVRILSVSGQAGIDGKKGAVLRRVSITFRIRRNPIIGDKFSSRHGQKGTLSVLWPQHDMPFSESGMSPDILINPHAFPSRMTIGMLVESMAGKSGALNGKFHDATPFQFHEENRAIDYLGEQLKTAGYHYYGSEPLYSGVSGTVLHADIFIGVVYYQRLRHMVSDKSQVRATGPVMAVTRQPVKGRKKHGGIRLGEMERDALLSHGVSFCVHDRLMNCSDVHVAHICGECGSLLNVHAQGTEVNNALLGGGREPAHVARKQYCNRCKKNGTVRAVYLPYIFRYLANELAGMGIVLNMKLSS